MVASPTQLLPLTLMSALLVTFLPPDNALDQRDDDLREQLRQQGVLQTANVSKRATLARVVEVGFEKRRIEVATQERREEGRDWRDDLGYYMNLAIGSPPQDLSVRIATDSSELRVPSSFPFSSPSTSSSPRDDGSAFNISYAAQTPISLPTSQIKADIGIGGVEIRDVRIEPVDSGMGVLGLGFDAEGQEGEQTGIVTRMRDQDLIAAEAYSVWMDDIDSTTGTILFGGIDTAKYIAPLMSIPIIPDHTSSSSSSSSSLSTSTSKSKAYASFTIPLSSLSFTDARGQKPYTYSSLSLPVLLDPTSSGTYLPSSLVEPIYAGLNATYNSIAKRASVPCEYKESNTTFTYTLGGALGAEISVPLSHFVEPSPGNSNHTAADGCGLAILPSDEGEDGGTAVLGDTFLRNVYVVYDLGRKEIALAQRRWSGKESDIHEIAAEGEMLPGVKRSTSAEGAARMETQTEEGVWDLIPAPQKKGPSTGGLEMGRSKTSAAATMAAQLWKSVAVVGVVMSLFLLLS